MKLLGFLSAFGGITFVLLNTERILKFVTRNHESMMYQKELSVAGKKKAAELAGH
jgi:hypothetical protein